MNAYSIPDEGALLIRARETLQLWDQPTNSFSFRIANHFRLFTQIVRCSTNIRFLVLGTYLTLTYRLMFKVSKRGAISYRRG